MIALIDADSLIYIIAWHFREQGLEAKEQVEVMCDTLVSNILKSTKADRYLGTFSASTNFRYEHYKFAPYKGTRRPKDEWVLLWKPVIMEHYIKYWRFFIPTTDVEADDIISCAHEYLVKADAEEIIICSPDKDLQQISGLHFDYKRPENGIKHVSKETAAYNFWLSVLTGDAVDNIKGLPSIGPVKAKALLIGKDSLEMNMCVQEQYNKAFGEYYGPIIYGQTLDTIQLLCSKHTFCNVFKAIEGIIERHLHKVPEEMLVSTDTRIEMGNNIEDLEMYQNE